MKNSILCLILLLCTSLCYIACTDAGLHEDHFLEGGGHNGKIQWAYQFPADTAPPSYMAVMAVRVINHWKCGMVVSTDNLRGYYFHNEPDYIEPWIDPSTIDPDTTEVEPQDDDPYIGVVIDPEKEHNGGEDPNPPTDEEDDEDQDNPDPSPGDSIPDENHTVVEHFNLPSGTYNFYTMSVGIPKDALYRDITNYLNTNYTGITDYLNADGQGMRYTDIEMVYNSYSLKDSLLHRPDKSWKDYNQGFEYIQTSSPAIYVGHQELVDVDQQANLNISFTPETLTQNIDIYFNITKDITENPFIVDSVLCEVSGIPCKASLFDGHLYLAQTRKMLFRTTLVDASGSPFTDSSTNESVRVHGNINVLSILESANATDMSGPGILQVAIFAHTDEVASDGSPIINRTRVQGKINLYETLHEAKLIKYSDDMQYATKSTEHAVLDIAAPINLKGTIVGGTSSMTGGLDEWDSIDSEITDDNGDPIER